MSEYSLKLEILTKIENFEELYGDNPYNIHITKPYSETVEEIDEEIQFYTNLILRKYKLQLKNSGIWIHPSLDEYLRLNNDDFQKEKKVKESESIHSARRFGYGEILTSDNTNYDGIISNKDVNTINSSDYEISPIDTSISVSPPRDAVKALYKIYNARIFRIDDGEELQEIIPKEDNDNDYAIVNTGDFVEDIISNCTKIIKSYNKENEKNKEIKDENKDSDYITVKLNILEDAISTEIILNS